MGIALLLAPMSAAQIGEEMKDEPGPADEAFLTIGDPAPLLDVAHWIRGEGVTTFEGDRIYVVSFWSTWCKYCLSAMPKLTRLQQVFEPDAVTFVGISDEKPQTVSAFLAKPEWDRQARFAIGADPDRSAQKSYMDAAAIGNIPVVFIVGPDSRIEWIGHPRELEPPLRAVIEGTWDRAAFKEEFEASIASSRDRFRHMKKMKDAYRQKDWNQLLRLFDIQIERDEKPCDLKVQKFMLMIGEMKQPVEGYDYGRRLLEEFHDEPRYLNNLAWYVVDSDAVAERDLGFAMRAARRACVLTDFRDAALLDTLARVYYETGNLEKAVHWQRRAVQRLRDDDPFRDGILAALEKYEEALRGPHSQYGANGDPGKGDGGPPVTIAPLFEW